MKVAQQPQNPLTDPIRIELRPQVKKITSEVTLSMYIATRRARLEAREAGFLVLHNTMMDQVFENCKQSAYRENHLI